MALGFGLINRFPDKKNHPEIGPSPGVISLSEGLSENLGHLRGVILGQG
jgi:hypothetical protein